jgi:hypothetical protein
MAPVTTLAATGAPEAAPAAPPARPIPWPITCAVIGVTSAMLGGHWDISWHRSIGRDTFWTAPHIAIYLCGVLAGISCGYSILATTLAAAPEARAASVRVWGFRGPLGAFIAAWGGIAMIASAPFDNWWHAAYGLDVAILSPPHAVLMAGILAVQLGTLILVLGEMNRAEGRRRRRLEALFLYVGGLVLVGMLLGSLEYSDQSLMHSAIFYRVLATTVPLVLVAAAIASGRRFAATAVAGVYTAAMLGFLWILPLFPASPKLGPVYSPVTHFIPPGFPLLVIAPALALDLARPWDRLRSRALAAAAAGAIFLAALLAAQWPFADFLMTPAARNWVFGAHYVDFYTPPEWAVPRFWDYEHSSWDFAVSMSLALAIAAVGARLGIACGAWMRRLRR